MLHMGGIEESVSKWCSPVILFPRPHKTIWFCFDFGKWIAVSKSDAYTML